MKHGAYVVVVGSKSRMVQGVCYLPSSKTSLAGVRNCNTPFSLYPFILCGSWVLLSLAAPNQSIACELCAPTDDDRKKRCGRRKKEKCQSFGATEPKDLCTHTHNTNQLLQFYFIPLVRFLSSSPTNNVLCAHPAYATSKPGQKSAQQQQ